MSLYRYARVTNSPAEREAAKWQSKVDDQARLIADLELIGKYRTPQQDKTLARARVKLSILMDENPNEPA